MDAYISVPFGSTDPDLTCGPIALDIALRYCNKTTSKDSLLKLLNINAKENTDIPSICLALINSNIKIIYHIELNMIPITELDTFNSIHSKLSKFLESIETIKKREYIQKLLSLMECCKDSGSKIVFETISRESIFHALSSNRPIITNVNSEIFSNRKIIGQHIIVINGISENDFIINSTKEFKKDISKTFEAIKKTKVPGYIEVYY